MDSRRANVTLIKTRRGSVIPVVRDRYLRNDLVCGSSLCDICEKTLERVRTALPEAVTPVLQTLTLSDDSDIVYLIPDLNVLLQQMDVLENDAMMNVIVLQSVLDELRTQNMRTYARLRQVIADTSKRFFVFCNQHHKDTFVELLPGETQKAYVERTIRVAARWYAMHFGSSASKRLRRRRPLVLTNNDASLAPYVAEAIVAKTIQDYAANDAPEFADIVVPSTNGDEDDNNENDGTTTTSTTTNAAGSSTLYPQHFTLAEIETGVKDGSLMQGKLRMNRNNCTEACVEPHGRPHASDTLDDDDFIVSGILIQGALALNRATDGDVVAIRLLPREHWRSESNLLLASDDAAAERDANALATLDAKSTAAVGGTGANDDEPESAAALPPQLDVNETNVAQASTATTAATSSSSALASAISIAVRARPTGVVVGIVRRSWKPLSGALLPAVSLGAGIAPTSALFVPSDRRMPRIRIHTRQYASLIGQRVVVAIDRWPRTSRYPLGHYVRSLGPLGDAATDTHALLLQYDIPFAPFSNAVMACCPPHPWSLALEDQASLARRADMRGLRVMSVDPPGCTDIDDALHCRQLANGNWEVGVHIADVSHFVRAQTPLDDEAANRATTVYLVDKRIDMLPGALSTDTCSLRGGEERLTFSVVWELDANCAVVATRFHKSIIKSIAALTYEAAQNKIDDKQDESLEANDLRNLNRIAKVLRAARIARGALTLASTQVRFVRTPNTEIASESGIADVAMYETRETNAMVEEWMLMANISVAEQLVRAYPQCALLRRHPQPLDGAFEALTQAAGLHGVTINAASSLSLARSLDGAEANQKPFFNKLLRILSTRCMSQAVYFCSGTETPDLYRHYGLAAGTYTHFTSPIRRYADIVVHRLLAASIGWEPLPATVTKNRVAARAAHINRRHKAAQYAGRESSAQFTLRFFRGRQVVAEAHVTRVKANGFTALVGRYGIESVVHLTPKPSKSNRKDKNNNNDDDDEVSEFVFDAEAHTLTRAASANRPAVFVRIFDPVKVVVEVDESRPHDVRLRLLCIDPPIGEGALPQYQELLVKSEHGVTKKSNTNDDDDNDDDDDKFAVDNNDDNDRQSKKKRKSSNKDNSSIEKKRRKRIGGSKAKSTSDMTTTTMTTNVIDESQSTVDVPVELLDEQVLDDNDNDDE